MASTSLTRVALSRAAILLALALPSTAASQEATEKVPEPAGQVVEPRSVMLLDLNFTCDGSAVVTGGDAVRVHDAATGKLIQHLDVSDMLVRSVACSPVAPELFAVAGDDGVVRLFRLGKHLPVLELQGHGQRVLDLDFSPDGALLLSSGTISPRGRPVTGEVRLWDVDGGHLLHSLDCEGTGVSCIAYSSDGQHIAVARKPNARDPEAKAVVELYDVRDWRLVRSIPFEPGSGFGLDFTRDGNKLLIAGGICVRTGPRSCRPTGKLWVVDLAFDQPARRIEVDQCDYFRSARITPAGDWFATGTTAAPNKPGLVVSVIQMRRMDNGKILWSRHGATGEPYGVTVSPDGMLVAGCTAPQIQIFKASTGEPVTTIDIGEAP